ncbi:ribosomal protein S2 [Collinsella intestinalis DSM 13280]|nr:ribosomal protein S2 [Collinsella intestinalis DSM 13280]
MAVGPATMHQVANTQRSITHARLHAGRGARAKVAQARVVGVVDTVRKKNREVNMATKINIRTLLEAGCHFGHQTRRWNPKMKPFIFGERNNIYILDLKQTIVEADKAYTFLKETAAKGGKVLFVGTKKQAQEAVKAAAERANMPYINQRWLGGMLTNFVTIRSRINRLEELEGMVADGSMALRGKKEQAVLGKELAKLQANLGGARELKSTPAALFVIDTKREENAIKEAKRLGIPVVALIDTNSDPDVVDYGIPCNDDAISAIQLMSELFADACLAGSGKEQISEAEMAAEAPATEAAAE